MVGNMIAQVIALLCIAAFAASAALAAEEPKPAIEISTATIGLRGGFDANPGNVVGGRGSPVLTSFATWDYIKGTLQDGYGVNLVLIETQYDPRELAAGRAHSLALKHGFSFGDGGSVQSTLTAGDEQSWSRRRSSLAWRERLDYRLGGFRVFANGEARITALNERNVFNLGDFLPRDENFTTLSLTPGIAYRLGASEIGLSFTASRTHFIDGMDYLGFRRDHDRFQPNLFFSAAFSDITLEGSLSPFRAEFPDKEFDTVERLLYTAKLRLPYRMVTLELASGRTVEDTTLPFSVINVVTAHEAKLSARIDEKHALSLIGRWKIDDYVGLDAKSSLRSVGVDYQYALGDGLTATASASLRKVKETGLTPVTSYNLLLGLQKRIDFSATDKPAKSES
jgi:hypothetical protein